VKLIPAQFVRPFVKSNKNDFLASHPSRARSPHRATNVRDQPAASFPARGGMTFAKTPFKLKVAMPDILENAEANLTPRMRNLISLL
jgi:transposase